MLPQRKECLFYTSAVNVRSPIDTLSSVSYRAPPTHAALGGPLSSGHAEATLACRDRREVSAPSLEAAFSAREQAREPAPSSASGSLLSWAEPVVPPSRDDAPCSGGGVKLQRR
jgi:hypothetical protein